VGGKSKISRIKEKELVQLIKHCEEKGFSLDKTLEFLDAIGTYDKMFVYRTFKDPTNEETSNASGNEWKSDSSSENDVRKGHSSSRIIGIMALVVLFVIFAVAINNCSNQKKEEELQEKVQMFTVAMGNAISYLEDGMYEIKEGFDSYQDGNYTHTSLDTVMKSYLTRAEVYWGMAETEISEAFEYMSVLKSLVDDKTYDHFVDMYVSVSEYRQAVSPYGKSSMQYDNDVSDANTMIHNAIARFKSYIFPISGEE